MDLSIINSACVAEQKPVVSLKDLPINQPHPILSAKETDTRFGKSILLDLGEKVVFLPKRVTDIIRPNLVEFVCGKYSVVFLGTEDVGKRNPITLFKIEQSQ